MPRRQIVVTASWTDWGLSLHRGFLAGYAQLGPVVIQWFGR